MGWAADGVLDHDELAAAFVRVRAPISDERWEITEVDIALSPRWPLSQRCLSAVLLHELGHALGLGHTSHQGDVMFGQLSPSRPADCPAEPADDEYGYLRQLYGEDAPPAVVVPQDVRVPAGAPEFVLHALAVDPEGRTVSYRWRQVAGAPVSLDQRQADIRFAAPRTGGVLRFEVTAEDPFEHASSATVDVQVVDPNAQNR